MRISNLCKKYEVLLILDEIATGFGRLGSLVEYVAQKSRPDIVSYGKMLTGGYLTLASTLISKKVYDAFLGDYSEMKHFFHGHTFTGNPLSCAVANENLQLYEKSHLIKKIQKTSRVFEKRLDEISNLGLVGDVRHKGMLMGIELVKNKKSKVPASFGKSTNKVIFDEAKRRKIYLRSLGNIVMLVPPLAISEDELNMLIDGTISTIKNISKRISR
jgi:adenosylmethionine-8-amino-7-oxononanoate aminotransferase